MEDRKVIAFEYAEKMMVEGDWVHVFKYEEKGKGEMWPRERVMEHMKKNEIEFLGIEALKIQHGLFSAGIYIQTKKEPSK